MSRPAVSVSASCGCRPSPSSPRGRRKRREGERAHGGEAEDLHAELVEASSVEETGGTGGQPLGLRRQREETSRKRAPYARHAVRCDRADRQVDPDPLDREDADDDRARNGWITIAAHGATNAQAAVIATSAATAPFSIIDRSGFFITSHDVTRAPGTPPPRRCVFMAT